MKGRSRSVAGGGLLASNLVVVASSVTAGLVGHAVQAWVGHRLSRSEPLRVLAVAEAQA